ncbi:preprotein translocase subunit SecE [Deltaproteobacteria bacterium]|nr:preprotein translocase subunit SecE [Deltaproteobacteria bacterium]
MKATHKKKKKGSRKKGRLRTESEIVSKSDSSSEIDKKDEKQKSRQVPSKSGTEKRSENRNVLFGYVNIALHFLRDAKIELKKVKWPTRKELLASTAMVIILVIAIAFFLGLIDFGLIRIIALIVG